MSTPATTVIGREAPGPPEPGGPWETACRLVGQYEFADARILRGVYRRDGDLLGRDMLLEARFYGLRFYLGVRVTGIIDEERDTGDGPERVWGWCYQTLEGHLEQGRLSYEVIKNLATGRVMFRVAGYSRPAPIPRPGHPLGIPAVRPVDAAAVLPQRPGPDGRLGGRGPARPPAPAARGPAGRHRAGAVRGAPAPAGTPVPRLDAPRPLK